MNILIKHRWTFFVIIILLYIALMVGMGINVWNFADGKESISPLIEVVKFELIALGGLGVVLPAYLNASQSIIETSQKEIEDRKKIIENTVDLIQKWDDPSLLAARMFTRDLKDKKETLSDKDFCAKIQAEPKLRHSIILVFNYFDYIRISLESDRVDKEILKHSLGNMVIDIAERFTPWLKQQPKEMQADVDTLKKLLA